MRRLESFLRDTIGLDAAAVGPKLIARVVQQRMGAVGSRDESEYVARLAHDPREREGFLEAVLVAETWFFRDRPALDAFAQLVRLRRREHPDGIQRVLSVPCATGEEAFSLVMTLFEAGIQRDEFSVDAVDISSRALDRARSGVYGPNSFRGGNQDFRARYFKRGAAGYALADAVHGCVSLRSGNVVAPDFAPPRPAYDFIFCRNLLIYFAPTVQAAFLERLQTWLKPAGILFVGPAELAAVLEHGFTPVGIPMAFACRKTTPLRRRRMLPLAASDLLPGAIRSNSASAVRGSIEELAVARELANAGELEQAAAQCHACLRAGPPVAAPYYLLGLIHDAAGAEAAEDYYRKALYLDPAHYEALLQLALLLERKGAAGNSALALRRRAERILQQM